MPPISLGMQRAAPPIGLVQVARYADPQNSSTTALLALLLVEPGPRRRSAGAASLGAARRSADLADPRRAGPHPDQRQAVRTKPIRWPRRPPRRRVPTSSDYSRLGDVLQAMKRHSEAADAYGRAIALAQAQSSKGELWSLLLLQASALEDANRWPEAKAALQQALALAPDQPLLLNFLGYAELERGENMDCRRGDDPQGERARARRCVDHRFARLGRSSSAARSTRRSRRCSERPRRTREQAEIQEHLGDALYKSGRRYEARFAWSAALVTAEDNIAGAGEGQARQRADAGQRRALSPAAREIAPAKLNLALHVRGKLPDGRHAIETVFAFCTDGDRLSAERAADDRTAVTSRRSVCEPTCRPDGQSRASGRAGACAKPPAIERRGDLTLDKKLAGCVGDWRRIGRCGRGAAAADVIVADRSGDRRARRSQARQRCAGLPAEPADARGRARATV